MSDLKSEFLCEIDAHLAQPFTMIGGTPEGMRMIAHVTGGTFEGPRLKGAVHPRGGDCATIRADGSLKIDVRICMTTHDGVNIYATYGGRIVMPPELMGTMLDPEAIDAVDPDRYFFRTPPLFEVAGDTPYAWLNHVVAVGVGRLTRTGVRSGLRDQIVPAATLRVSFSRTRSVSAPAAASATARASMPAE